MDGSITDWNKFERLTPYRIREVLLVASQFDRYILEESGYLAEILQEEYSVLNLSQAPRIIHSPDASDAMQLMSTRKFDLVITMSKVGTMDVNAFARLVKEVEEDIPIVMLSQNNRELATLKTGDGIDRIFVWGGDSRILLSICKLIEDEKNVENDVRDGDVQVILLVEDSRRFYSAYLPLLYTQLVRQTSNLIGDGGNLHEKLLRLRARAKILLASDMDSAKEIIDKYSGNIIGIFTDGRFPNQSGERDVAGLELVRYAQSGDRNLPILLQSKNIELKEDAEAMEIPFLHKEDPLLYQRIEEFMLEEMSFGDFIFRTPTGEEICRATNLEELVEMVESVPIETIELHAERNEFSHWLRARTEFALASSIRPMTMEDFEDSEGVREYIVDSIRTHISRARKQTIRDHGPGDEQSGFQRIGRGSLGGKGRGLAFFYTRMEELRLGDPFPGVEFAVPNSVVLGTGIFGDFIARNELSKFAYEEASDSEINESFIGSNFGDEEIGEIRDILEKTEWPIAVRSSSLLEDSSHQPFAGVYATYMLANDHPDLEVRLKRLLQAIKLVYASIFHKSAKAYVTATANKIEDERMAVVIQEVVGRETSGKFYPDISGAARSRNHYPVDPLKMEDGLAAVCIGLGRQVSSGGKCLRFSPGQPKRIHQFHSTTAIIETSQSMFFAIPMKEESGDVMPSEEDNLMYLGLSHAEEDRRLALVGSTYVASDDRIVDSIRRDGSRLVTFAPVLKHGKFPLAEILDHVLKTCEEFLSSPVELEFAIEVDEEHGIRKFAILQVRPLMDDSVDIDIKLDEVDRDGAVCISSKSLGNGVIDGIRDVVYVHPDKMNRMKTVDIVPLIEEIDAKLRGEGRPYILIGPGRWGSSDPSLGIPVQWNQIMGAKTIVEAPMADIHVDPSQGTHFFQNIVTFNIGYLTITGEDVVDWGWLDSIEAEIEKMGLRHVQLQSPLKVVLDSRDSEAIIVR